MTTLNKGSQPTDLADQRDPTADGYVHGPMSQQAASGAHRYDVHPQSFVRLVGCHQSHAATSEAARPLRGHDGRPPRFAGARGEPVPSSRSTKTL
jgi:hypothetical protein